MAKAKAKSNTLQDRFVRRTHVSLKKLLKHPDNFRIHSEQQMECLGGSLDELGWVDELKVNSNTGRIFDGHARLEQAKARGESTVPVAYYDLSEQDELKALAVHDRIAAMAGEDQGKLAGLLGKIDLTDPSPLQPMLQELAVDLKPLDTPPLESGPTSDPGPESGSFSSGTEGESAADASETKTKAAPIMVSLDLEQYKKWKALRGGRSNKEFIVDLIERGAAALEAEG